MRAYAFSLMPQSGSLQRNLFFAVEAGNKVTSRCWPCVLWREALKQTAPHLSWFPAVVPVGVLWLAVLRSPHHCLLQGILRVVSAMSSSQLPILHKI